MTAVRTLRIGTRASALARAQTRLVADALTRPGSAFPATAGVQIVPITTHGDRSRASLAQLGGTGVFVSALREALLAGEIDVAVHSAKDLPTAPAAGIALAAVPVREDPRDALVARDGLTLGELPRGSRVGTGSPRRAAQLLALGLGLEVVAIRGNVDSRLGRVRGSADGPGDLDAVVLALAGLRRLGRADAVTEALDPIQLLPAPAQGALALECRADDEGVRRLLAALDDPDSRAAITAERALLAALGAGCTAPIGALAVVAEGERGGSAEGEPDAEVFLRANLTAVDGSEAVRLSATGPVSDAEGVGRRLAAELRAAAAEAMIDDVIDTSAPPAVPFADGADTAASPASGADTAAPLVSGTDTAALLVSGTDTAAPPPAGGRNRESWS